LHKRRYFFLHRWSFGIFLVNSGVMKPGNPAPFNLRFTLTFVRPAWPKHWALSRVMGDNYIDRLGQLH
jgi:hypothetical protein